MDTTQFFQAATDSKINYLIEPLLLQGGANMISGQSFAGKTVFLLWLLGKLMRGRPLFTYRTSPCDVVYLNGDLNPLHRLSGYLSAGLEGDLTTPAFHYLRQSPETLTADHLGTLCDVV
jgi:AAA domain-containing protein